MLQSPINRAVRSLQTWQTRLAASTEKPNVRDFFLSPPDRRDPELLRETLKRLVFLRVVLLSVLLGTSSWGLLVHGVAGLQHRITFTALGATYFVSLINILWLRRTKQPRVFGYGQFGIDVLLATVAIYLTGSSGFISLYLLIIVAAAAVFSRHGAVIIAALSGLCYALLASGLLPPIHGARLAASAQDIFSVYASLVLIALVSGYLAKQLELAGILASTSAKNLDELTHTQAQLFNDISDGVITLDLASTITSINEAARAIVGLTSLTATDFVGKPLKTVLHENGVVGAEEFINNVQRGCKGAEGTLSSPKTAQETHLHYSVKELSDAEGNLIGKMLILNDVSHVKSMKDRLDLHERMAKLLAEVSDRPGSADSIERKVRMIGDSPVMKKVFALVERVAVSEASVLVTGESGTGKELIARAIHLNGPRERKPFVAINCGAIPENLIESELFGHKKGAFTGAVTDNVGLFRQAQGGTIFLDEIGELPLLLQTKLLRVLQEKTVRAVGDTHDVAIDVRIVAATNRDLKKEIEAGRFREDLYYRLNVVNITVPPLRDRKEDIPLLVRHFMTQMNDHDHLVPQISPDALQLLAGYPFPGNIRELENVIERALVLGGNAILPEHLPEEIRVRAIHQNGSAAARNGMNGNGHHAPAGETEVVILPIDLEAELQKLEQQYLLKALEQSGGVKKHAAELLGLNFRSFRYRLKKYGMGDTGPDASDDKG